MTTKKTQMNYLKFTLLFLLFSGLANAAGGGAGGGAIFTTAWTTLSAILGDSSLGFIIAAFMLIKALSVYMIEGGNWTKILMYILAAGFTASLVTLAQTLAGASF